jgi:hypothetical protein
MTLSMQSAPPASPSGYVHIQPDDKIVIMVRHLEMGQGVISWCALIEPCRKRCSARSAMLDFQDKAALR